MNFGQEKIVHNDTSLGHLLRLVEHKKIIVENLARLGAMCGYADARDGDAKELKCHRVVFEADHTAHCPVRRKFDEELVVRLIQTATEYYTEKLRTIDLLIGLAARVVDKEIGQQLQDLLDELNKKS